MKKFFKQTLRGDITEQERASLYDMLNIIHELNGSEVRVLAGSYAIMQNLKGEDKTQRNVLWWADKVAENIGFTAREQVLRYEENLIRQKLIAPRESRNGRESKTWNADDGQNGGRLTSLGYKLGELLED